MADPRIEYWRHLWKDDLDEIGAQVTNALEPFSDFLIEEVGLNVSQETLSKVHKICVDDLMIQRKAENESEKESENESKN